MVRIKFVVGNDALKKIQARALMRNAALLQANELGVDPA